MSQLSYPVYQNAQVLGGLLDSRFKHTDSMIASGIIPVGRGVVKVVGEDNQVQLPDATDNILFGVAHWTQAMEGPLPNVDVAPQYEENSLVNVLRQGAVVVYCETAFDPDTDTLYFRHTANGALVPGNFRNDADTAAAVSLSGTNYAVRNTLAAAGLLYLVLNKPV